MTSNSTPSEPLLNKRYRLIQRLGAGGMATVYQAEDTRLGRLVAIKMLHEVLANDPLFVEQFWHEAHAAANLTHPHIVTVHDLGVVARVPFIVMEFVEGQTLKQIINEYTAQGEYMPVPRMLALAVQMCAGIGYAHRAGLVHCDVKPHNMLVTPDDRVKVADFGIARAMNPTYEVGGQLVWGTPQYFAPEQAAGAAPTPASDVYALGVVMFEMLTGRLPFSGSDPTALAVSHMQENPPPVSLFNTAVSPALEAILLKVLAKEPSGRYRTADQLSHVLAAQLARQDNDTPVTQVYVPVSPPLVVVGENTKENTAVVPPPSPSPSPLPAPPPHPLLPSPLPHSPPIGSPSPSPCSPSLPSSASSPSGSSSTSHGAANPTPRYLWQMANT